MSPTQKDAPRKQSVNSDESSVFGEEITDDSRCGYFRCKPDCLQNCAKPRFLLVCMCLFGLVEAFIQWGLVNINISTWERRYQLRSTQSAWIVTSQDVANGVMAPIFGYLATFYHKGRMISIAAICMFVGSFLFLIPQFAADTYKLGGSFGEDTCDVHSNVTLCTDENINMGMDRWLFVFCVAQLFFGYVSCAMWTIGITYVDDNVTAENSALFLGIFNAFSALGAVLGFLLGGIFLEIYVDIGRVDMDEVTINSSDPRWVGAWWIGFAVAAVLSIPVMFFMPCFPKELPAVAKLRARKKSEAYKGYGDEEMKRENFGRSCTDLGFSLQVIFCNPVFILITIAGIVEVGGVAAFASFLPKIIQFQFGQTSSMAAIIAGGVLVPGAAIGQLLGGIIPKAMKLKFRGLMWMLIIAQFTCVLCSVGFLASCQTPQLAGYNVDWPFNSTEVFDDPFTQSCNVDCGCSTLEFAPICSYEGLSYFSPCHAGCTTETEIDGVQMYGNCSCLPNGTSVNFQAESGICSTSCYKFWIFMPLLLVVIIATFIENTGGYAVVMRVVPEKQRAFAFGVQTPIIRYLGNVPIPILFGLVFDLSCEVWQDNCGEQGSCWIYDTRYLSIGMFVACLIIKGVSGICFLIGVLIYKPPEEDNYQEKEETEVDAKDPDPDISADFVTVSGLVQQDGHKIIKGHNNLSFVPNMTISDEIENCTRL